MKLYDAILLGRFCGLNTADECVANVEMHSMSLFKYTEIAKELNELNLEYSKYMSGKLSIDTDEIDRKNGEEMDNWAAEEEEYRLAHPDEETEDLNIFNKE